MEYFRDVKVSKKNEILILKQYTIMIGFYMIIGANALAVSWLSER